MCSYASTCQTVGMNLGYFTSFTVFLALNDPDFCNKHLRAAGSKEPHGVVLLSHYLSFWGWAYLIITVCVWLFKREDNFQALGAAPAFSRHDESASAGRLRQVHGALSCRLSTMNFGI